MGALARSCCGVCLLCSQNVAAFGGFFFFDSKLVEWNVIRNHNKLEIKEKCQKQKRKKKED